MKSNGKSKIIILITTGIIFAFLLMIAVNFTFIAGNSIQSSENSENNITDKKNLNLSKISGKIHINGNSEWIAFKNDGNCTGEGTYSDPYVIEDLVIDGGESGSCIRIGNSDVFFRIENCTVYNSGLSYPDAGIRLSNVKNGNLNFNNCSDNYIGIYLAGSNNSTLNGNSANNNEVYGISYSNSNNTVISKNIVYSNHMGIILGDSHLNDILENEVRYNWIGIRVGAYSNNNLISKNIIMNSDGYAGLDIHYSDDNIVRENIFSDNFDAGIYSVVATNNLITENNFSNNDFGILFSNDVNDNIIYKNCFVSNRRLNAWDNGINNQWDHAFTGNYWDDYDGVDANKDDIGDTPYDISAIAQALSYVIPDGIKDNYPLMKCDVRISDQEGVSIELIILISVISGGAVIGVATLLLIRRKRKRLP